MVGMDHVSQYGNIDAIATEKSKLVQALPPDGTAVLNADDPLVLEMRDQCACRVLTYGLSKSAMLRAEGVCSDWPNRLSFTAIYRGESIKIETQLCGAHWVHSVLAAMAVGQAMGIPLSEAAKAVRNVPPFPGRMSPVTTPDGVTFICDVTKAPLWTIPAALEFMCESVRTKKSYDRGNVIGLPREFRLEVC